MNAAKQLAGTPLRESGQPYTIKFERFREKADNSLRPDQLDPNS